MFIKAQFAAISCYSFKNDKQQDVSITRGFITFPGDEFPLAVNIVGRIAEGARGTLDVEVTAKKEKLFVRILSSTFALGGVN